MKFDVEGCMIILTYFSPGCLIGETKTIVLIFLSNFALPVTHQLSEFSPPPHRPHALLLPCRVCLANEFLLKGRAVENSSLDFHPNLF